MIEDVFCVRINGERVWCFEAEREAISLSQNIYEELTVRHIVDVVRYVFSEDYTSIIFTAGVDPSPYDDR